MSQPKTLRERIDALQGFREAMRGSINEGRVLTLYEWVRVAVDSMDHYAETLRTNPRGTVKAMSFIMKQTCIIDELLSPLEEIMSGDMKTEEFINGRVHMYKTILRSAGPRFANGSIEDNILEVHQYNVYREILNVMEMP